MRGIFATDSNQIHTDKSVSHLRASDLHLWQMKSRLDERLFEKMFGGNHANDFFGAGEALRDF